jgi:hypothetical protein
MADVVVEPKNEGHPAKSAMAKAQARERITILFLIVNPISLFPELAHGKIPLF